MAEIHKFLNNLLEQYWGYIYESGAFDPNARYPSPDLVNEILPMFRTRWASGPGQHTNEIYHLIGPALRLASRLLTEKYCLKWFAHLAFGEQRRDQAGVYIVPTAYSLGDEAIAKVRDIIHCVGEVVTLMFQPPSAGHEIRAHGFTVRSRRALPFWHKFQNGGFPSISSSSADLGYSRPVIVINNDFQTFFRTHVGSYPQDEHYRVLLALAATLVHEFSHAYYCWLTPPGSEEPRWSESEKDAELGWSWERNVLGCGVDIMAPEGGVRNRFLYNFEMREYRSSTERRDIIRELAGSNRTDAPFTSADARGRIAAPRAMSANQFNYSSYYLDNDSNVKSYIAAVRVATMDWVTAWFTEEKWQRRSQRWRRENRYTRPSAGNAFVLLYECNGRDARTLRPLFPSFSVDRDILRRRERGDHSR